MTRHWTNGGWEDIAVASRIFVNAYNDPGASAIILGSLASSLRSVIESALSSEEAE